MQKPERKTAATLLVPYSVGSDLQKRIQRAEDRFCELVGGQRVRVLEKGGDSLNNLLVRNDPWAASRVCSDSSCVTCKSRTWIKNIKKEAKKTKTELPDILLTTTTNQCRREGCTYTVQCLDCLDQPHPRQTLYQGESSRSSRQIQGEHQKDLDSGLSKSTLVVHSIEEHGGQKPKFLYLVNSIEPRPLYRMARESVLIASQPMGPENLNRCQEWGAPRIPVLLNKDVGTVPIAAESLRTGIYNPRPVWSNKMMEKIEDGRLKKIVWKIEGDPDIATESQKKKILAQQDTKRLKLENETPELENTVANNTGRLNNETASFGNNTEAMVGDVLTKNYDPEQEIEMIKEEGMGGMLEGMGGKGMSSIVNINYARDHPPPTNTETIIPPTPPCPTTPGTCSN